MKIGVKKAIFGVLNLIFGLNVIFSGLMAMEEQPTATKKGVPPLTHLAAGAFIKSIQKDGDSYEKAIDCINQTLDEQKKLIQENEAVLGLIEQQLGRNSHVVEHEFDAHESIVGVIPELGHVITYSVYDNQYSIWSKTNLKKIGAFAGIATTPCFAYHLTTKKALFHNNWNKQQCITKQDCQSLGLDDNGSHFLVFCNKDVLVFTIGQAHEARILVLYRYKDGIWQQDSKIEMKRPILHCAYSEQDNILACALNNKTIVLLRNDADLNLWFEDSVITLKQEQEITNLAFVNQPFEAKPLVVINSFFVVDSIAQDSVSLWRFMEKKKRKKYVLRWKCIETIDLHENEKCVFYHEGRTLIKRKITKDVHDISSDFSRLLFIKNNEAKIYDAEDLLKVIALADEFFKELYYVLAFFIDNDTVAFSLIHYNQDTDHFSRESNIIISLKASSDFSLCTHILAKAQRNPTINVEDLSSSTTFQSLEQQEQEHVLAKIKKIKEQRSLKTKLKELRIQLRKYYKPWARQHPIQDLAMSCMLQIGFSYSTYYVHSKLDPDFSYIRSLLGNGVGIGVTCFSHVFLSTLLQRLLYKGLFE